MDKGGSTGKRSEGGRTGGRVRAGSWSVRFLAGLCPITAVLPVFSLNCFKRSSALSRSPFCPSACGPPSQAEGAAPRRAPGREESPGVLGAPGSAAVSASLCLMWAACPAYYF